MAAAMMTPKQRVAVEALEAARKQGCSLTQYARTHGLQVQQIYALLSELRKQGLLPKSGRTQRSNFVAVKVQSPAVEIPRSALGNAGVLCRITHASGYQIECLQWPPPSWLEVFSRVLSDAAP